MTAAQTRTILTTVAFLLGPAGAASAITPASAQQILCHNGTLVFATVLGAHSHDCRLHGGGTYCWRRGIVGVNVRVDENVPPSRENIRPGDVIQIAIRTHNDLPADTDPEAVRWDDSVPGMLGLPGTGSAVADRDAAKLIGTEFAFALDRLDYRDKGIAEPYSAEAYSMKDEAWVRAEWAKEACTKWRRAAP
jgi:hypothetical protein